MSLDLTTLSLRRPHRTHSDQLSVQSFRDLLRHLVTIVKNPIELTLKSIAPFDLTTRPDPLKQRTFQLLKIPPRPLAMCQPPTCPLDLNRDN